MAPQYSLKNQDYDNTECSNSSHQFLLEKLLYLEGELESLYSSIFSLTSQLAQVQLRLSQVINAPVEDRDGFLKALEDFVFCDSKSNNKKSHDTEKMKNLFEAIVLNRTEQKQIVNVLKLQLTELEKICSSCNFNRLSIGNDENLILQLKKQIADLENFVRFLQKDIKHHSRTKYNLLNVASELFYKIIAIIKMFTALHLERGYSYFKSKYNNHSPDRNDSWKRIQGKLVEVIEVIKKLMHLKNVMNKSSSGYDMNIYDIQLITAVRKYLAESIRDLIQHGASVKVHKSNILSLLNCFFYSPRANDKVHGWEIILQYYNLKNGSEFNSSPTQKLSKSFNLEIAGTSPIENKNNLLYMIGDIISTHSIYKRNYDSQFKAFICAALNANKLVLWLNAIFQCNKIIETHYYSWSYVATTKFRDSLQTLDVLTGFKFDLPVDLAVRKYQNIVDVFN